MALINGILNDTSQGLSTFLTGATTEQLGECSGWEPASHTPGRPPFKLHGSPQPGVLSPCHMLGGPPWGWTPVSSGLLLSLAGVRGQLSAGGEEDLGELSAPLGSSAVRLML